MTLCLLKGAVRFCGQNFKMLLVQPRRHSTVLPNVICVTHLFICFLINWFTCWSHCCTFAKRQGIPHTKDYSWLLVLTPQYYQAAFPYLFMEVVRHYYFNLETYYLLRVAVKFKYHNTSIGWLQYF